MAKAKETSDTERNTQETDAKTERNAQLFEAQIHALEEQITFLKSNYTKEAIAELITYIESIITQSDTSFYTDAEARTVVDSLEVQTHIITNLFMSINSVPLEMTSPSISYIQVLNYIRSIHLPTHPTIEVVQDCAKKLSLIAKKKTTDLAETVLSDLIKQGIINTPEYGTIAEPVESEPITNGGGAADNSEDSVTTENITEPIGDEGPTAPPEGHTCSLVGLTSIE